MTPEPAVLSTLSATRRKILLAMKRQGELRAEELARELGVTLSAARQQLAALGADNLVTHRQAITGPGRPKHVFRLTPLAESLFPNRDWEVAELLLKLIEELASDRFDADLAARAEHVAAAARAQAEGLDAASQVELVARLQEREGYLCEVEEMPGEAFVLSIFSCPIVKLARLAPRVCALHERTISESLGGAHVRALSSLLNGQPACDFLIRLANGERAAKTG